MSSITPTDRSRQTDELRSNREEYQEKTAEQAKKQRDQLRRLNKAHDEEVQAIRDGYEKQIDEIKTRSSSALSERDQENQSKIEKVRSLYSDSLKKKTEDNDSRRTHAEQTYKADLEHRTKISNQQKELLKSEFESNLKEKDRDFSTMATSSREEMQNALKKRAEYMRNKQEKELGAVVTDRDRVKETSELKMDQTRQAYDNKLKDQDRLHRLDSGRIQNNWQQKYQTQDGEHQALLQSRDALLAAERNKMQDRFQKATDNKQADLENAYEHLKENATERVDREVRSANNEKNKIESQRVVDLITGQRVKNIEKANLVDAYEKRLADISRQRDQIRGLAGDESRQRIGEVIERADRFVQHNNRTNKMNQSVVIEQFRGDRQQKEIEHKSRLEHVQNQSEARLGKILKDTTLSQKMLEKINRESVDGLKGSYHEQLADQRQAHAESLKETYVRMEQRLKEVELKSQKNAEFIANNYEAKLGQQEEKFKNELKTKENAFAQRFLGQEKAHKQDIESQNMKLEIKLAQSEETHQKEIERLERRHQEQMQTLAGRVNSVKNKV